VTDDDYEIAPARQVGALSVTIRGSRATLSREAHRWLVASVPEVGARVRWLVRKDGSGFALEAVAGDRTGTYSLRSHHIQVAPRVMELWPDSPLWPLTAVGSRLVGLLWAPA
jgi:hypothetical protein